MQPSREKIADGGHHEFSREEGYVAKPYEFKEYPKNVPQPTDENPDAYVTVNSAEEEAALNG